MLDYVVQLTRDATRITPEHHARLRAAGFDDVGILQITLMNPQGAPEARDMFRRSLPLMLASFKDEQIRHALKQVDRMVGEDNVYEALKAIRSLYGLERKALLENDDEDMGEAHKIAVGAR